MRVQANCLWSLRIIGQITEFIAAHLTFNSWQSEGKQFLLNCTQVHRGGSDFILPVKSVCEPPHSESLATFVIVDRNIYSLHWIELISEPDDFFCSSLCFGKKIISFY